LKLSVIIVNYNVKYFLEQCLCSVREAIKNIDGEILVIDNSSTDGSINYLKEKFPRVNFIANKENAGFAKANNAALKTAKGEFILFLNPDTILPENVFIECTRFFETNATAGVAGVRMIDGSGKFLPESKRSFPSLAVSFFKLTGLSALFPHSKIFGKYALGYLDENEIHEVDVLAGAFFFTRKKILDECGSFDESFFMYGEDIDLSYRIQQAGFKNYYLGNKTIIHFKGESTKKNSLNYVRMFFKAMSLFVKKHYHGAGAWIMNAGLQLAIILRAIITVIATPFIFIAHLFHKKVRKKNARKIILIGDEIAAKKAQQIIAAQFSNTIFETISSFADIDLKKIIADEIVFCIGELNYSKAISLLQQTPVSIDVKWFGGNSKSIAGSNHKDFQGEAYF
jgi:GT2 family glycosyltransferase